MRPTLILSLMLAGLASPALADCVEIGRGSGEILAEMTRAELNRDERLLVEERFGPDFAEAARLGIAADALFRFARCELNGTEPVELVAVGRSPAHCAGPAAFGDRGQPPVCGIWALSETPEGWVQVLETAGAARLSASTTNGWRDVVVERGGAPAVWKYGGAVYQEDLGDADPQAYALEDYGGYGQGPAAIDWFAFDDPMPEAIDAAFLWFYGVEIRGTEGRVGVLPDAFRVGAVDLDEDGAEEAVIQGLSPDFCGPEGCQHWVLEGLGRQDPPRISGRLLGFDLQAAATGGRGGRDLIASSAMGLIVYRNDGDGWALPSGDGN
ncbi:hypothetical protein [Albimonas pacifica]|uniref:Repeat domain-containing protein n=1 Tax=Albimonas pacifica TaxID=1114924 RepID=A0A1I3DZ59_9RHOB|nr:hypothetical protein [Albimonas pacifica]SFH92017.1 hypothetical protein SAMN05216258_10394 [Albimonas pacifica]